jgi:hypothetical protein
MTDTLHAFRQDNTEGFTDAELAAMNDEYYHELQIAVADLPNGAAEGDLIEQIKQSTAEIVLRRHGAA